MATTTTRTECEWAQIEGADEAVLSAQVETVTTEDSPLESLVAQAQADEARANADAATAMARRIHAEAELAEMELREAFRAERHVMARDVHPLIYRLTGPITPKATRRCMEQLDAWEHYPGPGELEIALSSTGGDVTSGMALFDVLTLMRGRWHITTSARGYCASMAAILLQAGDVRICGPESYVMIHEVAGSGAGPVGEMSDTVAWLEMVQGRVNDIFVSRSEGKLTLPKLRSMIKRKDCVLDSSRALELGIIDEIR